MIVNVKGSIELTIFEDAHEISDKNQLDSIIEDLNEGVLFLGLDSKRIYNRNFKEVYSVSTNVLDDTVYSFENGK